MTRRPSPRIWPAVVLALAIIVVMAMAFPARAQTQCAPRDRVVAGLAANYGETRRSLGLLGSGQALELFVSDDTGTWTITTTSPDGMSCLVASGGSYEAFAAEPAGVDG